MNISKTPLKNSVRFLQVNKLTYIKSRSKEIDKKKYDQALFKNSNKQIKIEGLI